MFEGRRAKLIDGIIIEEGIMNLPHAGELMMVDRAIRIAFGDRWMFRCQLPLVLGQSTDPMPDLAVVKGSLGDGLTVHPTTAALIVEIADTSVKFDTEVKRPLYAQAGIAEYWVVDINERRLFVFRDPRDGDYPDPQVLGVDAAVSPLAATTATVCVTDLLG